MSHYDSETGLLKISWSKIRTAEECRQKAYLTSEGKKSVITDVRVFFQGNVVDRAMRQWLSMKDPPRLWMMREVDRIFNELEDEISKDDKGVVRWRHRDDRQNVRYFCQEAVLRLEPILNQLVTPYEYQPALRFKTRMNIPGLAEDGPPVTILLNGEMDVLTREAGKLPEITLDPDPMQIAMDNIAMRPKYRVWDLKVTKDAQYWRKTTPQLVFYDIVCSCLFGLPTVEAGLIQPMVDSCPWLSFTPSDEDRTVMYSRIVNVAHSIMRQDYSPKVGTEGCDRCECRNACVRYAPEPGTKVMPLW